MSLRGENESQEEREIKHKDIPWSIYKDPINPCKMSRRKGSLNDHKPRATHSLSFQVQASHLQAQEGQKPNLLLSNEGQVRNAEISQMNIWEQKKGGSGKLVSSQEKQQQEKALNSARGRAPSKTRDSSNSKKNKRIGGSEEQTQFIPHQQELLGQQKVVKTGIDFRPKSHGQWREEESGSSDISQSELLRRQHSRIEELRHQYEEQHGRKWIDESLANEFENSTHFQEIEENDCDVQQNEIWNQSKRVSGHPLPRTQYRKTVKIEQKKTLENIKEIIKKQQLNMKEYLGQRTTEATDDQNIGNNLNNKSSSEEALAGDSKIKYEISAFGDFLQGNYFKNSFKYPQKACKKVSQKQTPARELSTSHDTTKLIIEDDQTPVPPKNQEASILENYYKNVFSFTHPIISLRQQLEKQVNNTCKPSNQFYQQPKPVKKNLTIISDFQLQEMLQCQGKNQQLCPRRSNSKVNPSFPLWQDNNQRVSSQLNTLSKGGEGEQTIQISF